MSQQVSEIWALGSFCFIFCDVPGDLGLGVGLLTGDEHPTGTYSLPFSLVVDLCINFCFFKVKLGKGIIYGCS